MSNENPTNSREVFDENEAGIAQKKQEITDAVATGDYGKVAELAQAAKEMETAKGDMIDNAHDEALLEETHGEALKDNEKFDEATATLEKAKREGELAEQAKQDAENSQKEAAALLEKMKGGSTENKESDEVGKEVAQIENSLERNENIDNQEARVSHAETIFDSKIGAIQDYNELLKLREEVLAIGWGDEFYTKNNVLDNPETFTEPTLTALVDIAKQSLNKIKEFDAGNPVISELEKKVSDFEQKTGDLIQHEKSLLFKIKEARNKVGETSKSEKQEDVSLSAEAQEVENSLMDLFQNAWKRGFDERPELESTKATLEKLDAETQEKIAQDFFDRTSGQNILYIRDAYTVYNKFTGTAFGDKFKELESARLVAAGFTPLGGR